MAKILVYQEYETEGVTRHPEKQQSQTDRCGTRRLPLLSGVLQRCWLMLIAASFMLFSACAPGYDPFSGPATVVAEVARQELSFSVLTINLDGTAQVGSDTASWEDRYGRIADWMKTTGKIPDFIALQEVHGRSGVVKDYDTLFTLITKIAEKTNVVYRIAYLIVGPTPQGVLPWNTLWAGNALLYNPGRVNNSTQAPNPPYVPPNYDDESYPLGLGTRKSLPCADPSLLYKGLCSLIDGDGLAQTFSYRDTDTNRWSFGPVFARFHLDNAPGDFIHIYNVHVQYQTEEDGCCPLAVETSTKYLAQLEQLASYEDGRSDRLYPPLILGDFNIGAQHILGHFPDYEIARYADREVMGVLVGKQSKYPSSQKAYIVDTLILPEDYQDPGLIGSTYCGRVGTLWSDHCAVFVQFSPLP